MPAFQLLRYMGHIAEHRQSIIRAHYAIPSVEISPFQMVGEKLHSYLHHTRNARRPTNPHFVSTIFAFLIL
jgi:hypothetical protein